MKNPLASTALLTVLALVLTGQLACLKAKEKPVDFGPEANPADVFAALGGPLQNYTPANSLKGEKAEWKIFYYVKNSDAIPAALFKKEVVDRADSAEKLDLKVQRTATTLDTNGKEVKVTVFEPDLQSYPKTAKKPASIMNASEFQSLDLQSIVDLTATELISKVETMAENRVTYHSLSTEQGQVTLPSTIQDKTVCPNAEECAIPVTYVRFDQIEWKGEGPAKRKFEFILATGLPFMAYIDNPYTANLRTCVTGLEAIEGKKILLTICAELINFAFGTP